MHQPRRCSPPARPVAVPQAMNEQPRPKGFYAATRAGKKKATVTLSTEAHRQLKLLAVDHGGVEALLTEQSTTCSASMESPAIA